MTCREYERIVDEIESLKDIRRLSRKYRVYPETLRSILIQKIIRKTLRRFHIVKRRSARMKVDWDSGLSFIQLSEKYDLPPILCATFVLSEKGMSKKMIRSLLSHPSSAPTRRLRKELEEASDVDFVYSQRASVGQQESGRTHEIKLGDWLIQQGISFWTEMDRSGEDKTPDFLLKRAVKIKGHIIHWLDSKAYFADDREIRRSYMRQFKPYVNLFGPGMVVYWYGFVKDAEVPPGLYVVDGDFFKRKVRGRRRFLGRVK